MVQIGILVQWMILDLEFYYNLYFRCGGGSVDSVKSIIGYTDIPTPLPIDGVLSNITSSVQNN